MKKRVLAGVLALVLVVSLVSSTLFVHASAVEPSEQQVLTYEMLEARLQEHGPSYLMLEETIKSIESLDYEKMKDDLRDGLSQLGKAQWGIMQIGKMPQLSSSASYSYTYGQLDQTNASMRESFEALKDGDLQEDNAAIIRQLRDTQNQMLLGAQSLYVALLEMNAGRAQLTRELASMGRTVAEMTLRHQRGQISDLQLAQVKSGQEQMNSALTTLERNIRLYTVQLQTMLGMELTGELTLSEVPEITDAQIGEMNYEKDLAAAREMSYTLYSADEDLEDAKDSYLEVARQYGFNESRYEFISVYV